MDGMPGAVFVVDPKKERIAVREARILDIPVVGIIDTNYNLDLLASCGAVCEFGGTGGSFLDGLDLLSPAPGVPLQNPLVVAAGQRGIPIMGELALAAGRFRAPVIAVTGSNGKTTTTGLIGHLLKTADRRTTDRKSVV